MDERDWEEFKAKLKRKTEIDLDLYKAPQMQRRIMNLARRNGYDKYSAYFDKVVQDKDDFAAFIEYLTINVSEFFRTPDKFAKLETDVIPELMKRSSRLNVWSAGCSIGAEPYSLAMILNDMTPNTRHRILATDLDIEILAKAKAGVYNDNELKAKECKFVDKAPKEKKTSAGNGKKSGSRGNSFMGKTQQAHRDIDIRGMMVDEAEVALDRFIDDSVMAGLSQVLIIHGKGTGALRKGVHSYLKRHRNVANFNFADMSEGGTGATLVELQ